MTTNIKTTDITKIESINTECENIEYRIGTWCWIIDEDKQRHLGIISAIRTQRIEVIQAVPEKIKVSYNSCPTWYIHINEAHDKIELISNEEAEEHINSHISDCKNLLKTLTNKMIELAKISTTKALPSPESSNSVSGMIELCKTAISNLPALQEDIKLASAEFACWTEARLLPMKVVADSMQDVVDKIEDRLFDITLYAGSHDKIKQLCSGDPASIDTKITVRQRILYMDEESLIDYDDNGMDFSSIDEFDKWVSRKHNMDRLLPEQRCIVAFQVRRYEKRYFGKRITSFAELFIQEMYREKDRKTYLLIRNGENLYRVIADIDFSPRLIPLKTEIDDTFQENDWIGERLDKRITKDDLYYDDYLQKAMRKMHSYNRIVILIQGLLDRSNVFQPIPKIDLRNEKSCAEWLEFVRDEEFVLESNEEQYTIEKLCDELNVDVRKGDKIVGADLYFQKLETEQREKYGEYFYQYCTPVLKQAYETKPEVVSEVIDVRGKRKGKIEVKVRWTWTEKVYDHWDGYRESKIKWHTLWVPIHEFINLRNYKKGMIDRFTNDWRAKKEYNKWAKLVLAAEKHSRKT